RLRGHRERLWSVRDPGRIVVAGRRVAPDRVGHAGDDTEHDAAAEEPDHRRSLAPTGPKLVDLTPAMWDDPGSYVALPAQPEPPPYVTASTKRYSPHPLVPPGREGFCLPEIR